VSRPDPAFYTPLGLITVRAIEETFDRAPRVSTEREPAEARGAWLSRRVGRGTTRKEALVVLIARVCIVLFIATPWLVGLVVIGWYL
jgi:hypothetical protein